MFHRLPSQLACGLLLLVMITVGASACTKTPKPSTTRDRNGEAHLIGRLGCAPCHQEEAQFCDYGAHRRLQCESCHGAGSLHAEGDAAGRPALTLGDANLCLSCHQSAADGDPATTSRIESFAAHLSELEQEHRIQLDRERSGTDCVYCHDPHLLE